MARLQIGDKIGMICKTTKNGVETWELVEDKINKITETKKDGVKYYTPKAFCPIDAEKVDKNTKDMEYAVGKGYILTREVFGLNIITRPFAENWVSWANENMKKVISIVPEVDDTIMEYY